MEVQFDFSDHPFGPDYEQEYEPEILWDGRENLQSSKFYQTSYSLSEIHTELL